MDTFKPEAPSKLPFPTQEKLTWALGALGTLESSGGISFPKAGKAEKNNGNIVTSKTFRLIEYLPCVLGKYANTTLV